MVETLTYRTADGTRWGGGQGSNLSAAEIDLNFWTLFSSLQALEDHADAGAGIDYISQPTGGDQFYVHLTDHRVLGPFKIPTAMWTPRGQWVAGRVYARFDVVYNDGAAYLITVAHTSATTFDANAMIGFNKVYVVVLEQPMDELPAGGTIGQRLVKSTDSPYVTAWQSEFIRMSLFVNGQPDAGEILMQYPVSDHMIIRSGLVNSVFYSGTDPASDVTYELQLNFASIGSVTFLTSPAGGVSVDFGADVACVPGDIVSLLAPGTPDASQSDISFNIIAELTA